MHSKIVQPNETTRLLVQTARLAKETEEIGDATTHEVQMQGEKIESTGSYLESISNLTSSARSAIWKLKAKVVKKKVYLWIIMVGLFLANLIVIAVLIRNNGKLF
jgi:hypothetical protein